jgi:hypothetical protein
MGKDFWTTSRAVSRMSVSGMSVFPSIAVFHQLE